MNKGFIGAVLAIFSSTLMLTSCNQKDNKNEVINKKKLESVIHEKLEDEINEEDINIVDLDSDGKNEYIVRYRTKQKESPLRIMIMSEKNGKPVIQDEIKNVGEDFDEIKYIDINNDGKLEIIAGFKVGENLSKGISIYEFKNGKAIEIFEEYYSEYVVRDLNHDNKKEVVLIKEEEKEGKSYAYLYMWQEDGFENTKKVEIDPTLDTKDEIFKKLLKK